jgi:hypothetical protein
MFRRSALMPVLMYVLLKVGNTYRIVFLCRSTSGKVGRKGLRGRLSVIKVKYVYNDIEHTRDVSKRGILLVGGSVPLTLPESGD